MELNQISNASTFYGADGTFSATEGQKFKIDISGVKQFEVTVPEGKQWVNILISMKIEETNI